MCGFFGDIRFDFEFAQCCDGLLWNNNENSAFRVLHYWVKGLSLQKKKSTRKLIEQRNAKSTSACQNTETYRRKIVKNVEGKLRS